MFCIRTVLKDVLNVVIMNKESLVRHKEFFYIIHKNYKIKKSVI